ncbi:MAG TPA: PBP1A family penicillin-binding protein [Gemmatimonadaceae bacterium]|nr:PBP1A family penicillin-binding protein [Gemmatimonadaceae bacterium]
MAEPSFSQRLKALRERLRPDPELPARIWMRRRWRSLAALGVAVLGVVLFDAWLLSCGFEGCPSRTEIRAFRPTEGSRVYDRSGRLIGRLTYVKRLNVPLSVVPRHVRQAFIATEDRRFYEHNGLDWRGFFRATLRNITSLGVREGFSTITMQVARNTFTPQTVGERSLRRKMMELRLARLIERNLRKDEILELYLNVIYLGNGVYGVEAASRDLFGKPVRQVTLSEAAVLAALPKGPSAYTPRRNPERARARRNLVLSLMVREGFITRERARSAAAAPLRVARNEWRPPQLYSAAMDVVRSMVDSIVGSEALEKGDVDVWTTLDLTAQQAAERAVSRRAIQIDRESRAWYGGRGEQVEGAFVAIDPRNGDIRALVGGRRYEPRGFNRAVYAKRQPGSAFKPFVYAAALAAGFTPATEVDDTPIEVDDGGQIWRPANYGDEYSGRVTMRRALMRSANAATVRFSRAVGETRVIGFARQAGIGSQLEPLPSVALGAFEVTPLELVAAYAPFANGGMRVTPRLLRRIEATDGRVLWSSQPAPTTRVMAPEDAHQLTSMLRSVVDHGTGRPIRDWGANGMIAGKTGTTNNGADVWFIGYTPNLVAGVWFGYDSPRALSGDASGGRLAAPAWAEFYRNGWRETSPQSAWDPPPGMIAVEIDSFTGELANEWCPVTQRAWFKLGTEPTEPCRSHEEPIWETEDIGDKIESVFKRIFKF